MWPQSRHWRWSYVEVVDKNKKKVQGIVIRDKYVVKDDKVVEMSWDGSKYEYGWIERCAMGILNDFSSIQSVNKRLCNRDFSLSSKYLGDKSIVWEFESGMERDGFIKNHFFWDDCFSSMGRWSDSDVPKSRLVWVNCSSFLLRCWSEIFFKKVGWLLREPVLLAEETKDRRRINRGRMLVLIPHGYVCPRKIRVEEGPSLSKVCDDKFGPNLDVNALEEGMENAYIVNNEMKVSKGTNGPSSSNKGNGGRVNARKECGKGFSKLSMDNKVDKVSEWSNSEKDMFVSSGIAKHMGERSNQQIQNDNGTRHLMGERRNDHMGEGTENDILKPTKASGGTENDILMSRKASGGVGSNVGYIGKTKNREEREKCGWVEGKNLKGANFGDPAIDLFVDLGGLGTFWSERKSGGFRGDSVESCARLVQDGVIRKISFKISPYED
ncbi:hypothetical protein Dsin_026631 [Dipteronia sinensis]|uniref:DUF4283 domain-containing protein n=1 Tax=Dipteronia sinensis TaxID=43782 RepID=A0AAD9ZYN8_9ROSI|nr:hypothetical protein Dsin_026631 [Dipteronia sinensis]